MKYCCNGFLDEDLALRQSRIFYEEDEERNITIAYMENIQAIRSGCLFRIEGSHFKFIHKSIVEYLVARSILQGNLEKILNQGLLTKEPEILARLVEKAKKETELKERLEKIILRTKTQPELGTAGANAITILNRMGENFERRDYSDIQIPGADLSGSLCFETNFQRANLEEVQFNQALLLNANLRGANMAEVDFGERAYLQVPSEVKCIACYEPGERIIHWLVGCEDGTIYRYDDKSGEVVDAYSHGKGVYEGRAMGIAVSHSRHVLASCGDELICLRSLTTGTVLQELEGHTAPVVCLIMSKLWLFSGSWDSTIRLWRLPEGETGEVQEGPVLTGHTFWVTSLALSGNGWLASGSRDKTIRLWRIPQDNKGKVIVGPLLDGHSNVIRSLAFNEKGWLISVGGDETMRLWNFPESNRGEEIAVLDLKEYPAYSNCLAVHKLWIFLGCVGPDSPMAFTRM